MKRLNIDDVGRLSRGKSTKSKIGSRRVPHRLNKLELEAFERAKKYGFLKYNKRKYSVSLLNVYNKYCEIKNIKPIIKESPSQ